MTCFLRLCVDKCGYECSVCQRFVSESTIRERVQVYSLLLNVIGCNLVCGVPSEYDSISPQQRKYKTSEYLVDRSNELVGQEGGVWDKFYLEG